MSKQKIKKVIYVAIVSFLLISNLYFLMQTYEVKQECKALYEKEELTMQDLKTKSTFVTSSSILRGEEGEVPPEKVSYKKLYGVEYIGKYIIEEEGGIKVKFLHGDPAKILILDEEGKERFYAEVSELEFEPGEAGGYDVYLVGNKFTGRIEFSTYYNE